MDTHRLRRTRSVVVLPQSRNRSISPGVVQRVYSVPDLSNISKTYSYVSDVYRPKYRSYRDWNLYDEYWWDRRYYMSPLYWPSNTRYQPRRYYYADPPTSLWWNYPSRITANRSSLYDYLDPLYWRRYRDPSYDRPLYYPYRPWVYENMDLDRASRMYRSGLITFSTLNNYWLSPSYFENRFRDWRDLSYITPSDRYGYRRYYWDIY